MKHGPNFKDLTGQQFGRLTVLRYNFSDKQGKAHWFCQCSCGKQKTIGASNLHGGTKSCGCLRKELISKPPGIAMANERFSALKHNASVRGLECSITKEYFLLKTQENCFYCGASPVELPMNRKVRRNGQWTAHGLDRVNNQLGYHENNLVSCCKHCNIAKHKMSQDEFIRLAHSIAELHPIPRSRRKKVAG